MSSGDDVNIGTKTARLVFIWLVVLPSLALVAVGIRLISWLGVCG